MRCLPGSMATPLVWLLAGGPISAMSPPPELTIADGGPLGIVELHVSPENATDWGADRLAGGRIAPGHSFRVRLGRSRECAWDLAVTYDDDSREELRGFDVCASHRAIF